MKSIKKMMRGFTLIEVMVVVVILGILATVIVPKVMSRPEQARKVKVQQDLMAIENALELYRLDNGFYPSTDQGLNALVTKATNDPVPAHFMSGGYLKRVPKDPWGNIYQYLSPGQQGEFDVFSTGKPGTEEAAYIGNWDADDR